MRISTSMMHHNAVNLMMKNQAAVDKTRNEVSSGLRVEKPSDDPVAAVKIMQLQQAKAANTQFGTNISSATTRLEQEEQALSDSQNILQRVHELAVKANSSALSSTDRQSIATELKELNKQLADVGNRKDSNGEFLFSGLSSATQPFSRNASNQMTYAGDAGTRGVQIGAAQYVQDGDSGLNTFVNVPQGNGTFVLNSGSTNAGTGVISGSLQNTASWVPDDYTLTFTSPTAWTVTNSASTVVTSGTNYVAGTAIAFNGIQVSIAGTPATGDNFAIAQSRTEDVFKTIDSLVSSMAIGQSNDASKAQFQNQLNQVLQQLDQTESHLSNVRTSVGARLSMLTNVESTRQDASLQIDDSVGKIAGADFTEASSRLAQQLVGLQAAQQSYVKVAQLSLFNYL
jgi:flagellar hook-associated protein 3 FlgL